MTGRLGSVPVPAAWNLDSAVLRAQVLSATGRVIIGVAGVPGAGKSWVSERLVASLGEHAALVPMDGFHLSNEHLVEEGMRDRKGAWDTFDVLGYVSLLERLRRNDEDVVFAPRFDRHLEQSIGSAVPVPHSKRIIITEGNYLLSEKGHWPRVRPLLDECWFLQVDPETQFERLIERRLAAGEDEATGRKWVMGVDMVNTGEVLATKSGADAYLI